MQRYLRQGRSEVKRGRRQDGTATTDFRRPGAGRSGRVRARTVPAGLPHLVALGTADRLAGHAGYDPGWAAGVEPGCHATEPLADAVRVAERPGRCRGPLLLRLHALATTGAVLREPLDRATSRLARRHLGRGACLVGCVARRHRGDAAGFSSRRGISAPGRANGARQPLGAGLRGRAAGMGGQVRGSVASGATGADAPAVVSARGAGRRACADAAGPRRRGAAAADRRRPARREPRPTGPAVSSADRVAALRRGPRQPGTSGGTVAPGREGVTAVVGGPAFRDRLSPGRLGRRGPPRRGFGERVPQNHRRPLARAGAGRGHGPRAAGGLRAPAPPDVRAGDAVRHQPLLVDARGSPATGRRNLLQRHDLLPRTEVGRRSRLDRPRIHGHRAGRGSLDRTGGSLHVGDRRTGQCAFAGGDRLRRPARNPGHSRSVLAELG